MSARPKRASVENDRAPNKQRLRSGRSLPEASFVRRSHLLVLGTSRPAVSVQSVLTRAGVVSHHTASPGENDRAVTAQTRGLVIVPPIADLSVAHYCRLFRRANLHIPVVVVTAGTLPRRGVRELYESGALAVFEWPGDEQVFVRTAFRLAGSGAGEASPAREADVAIEELVNERLRTASTDFGPKIAAKVQEGRVALSGEVDALWKLHVAEQVAAVVPGVVEVRTRSVQVAGPNRTDGAIANAIRQVLKHATEVDPSTIAIRVENGHVVLAGSTSDRAELVRALALVHRVRGVRGVDNYATVSREAKEQDRSVARRVVRAINTQHPKSNVNVAVFGGIGVLSGIVESADRRRQLEELVDHQAGVDRVVDKLEVRPS